MHSSTANIRHTAPDVHARRWPSRVALALAGALVAVLAAAAPAMARAGDLDPSFDCFERDGRRTVDFGRDELGVALLRQPDGKLVAIGTSYGEPTSSLALARLNYNGSLDHSFGGDGRVEADPSGQLDEAVAAALAPDGKIVVLASRYSARAGAFVGYTLTRFLPDGRRDPGFGGGDGAVLGGFGRFSEVADVALTALPATKVAGGGGGGGEPKIVVLGSENNGISTVALARHDGAGGLDPGFGGDGKVATTARGLARGLAVQPRDGRLVALAEGGGAVRLLRFNPGGGVDRSFGGGDGRASDPIGEGPDFLEPRDVLVQPDGRIAISGRFNRVVEFDTMLGDFALVRYLADGRRDRSFGDRGLRFTDFGTDDDGATSLALGADGKLVLAGRVQTADDSFFGVARYTSGGDLDRSFGDGGRVLTRFGTAGARAADVEVGGGRIVVAGTVERAGRRSDLAVARYLAR